MANEDDVAWLVFALAGGYFDPFMILGPRTRARFEQLDNDEMRLRFGPPPPPAAPAAPAQPAPEFEREELSSSDAVSSQEQESRDKAARGCDFVARVMNDVLDCDTTFGEGLMSFMEDAQKISEERSCEGYYIAACNRLAGINRIREKLVMTSKRLVTHHNESFADDQKVRAHFEQQMAQMKVSHDAQMDARMNRIRRTEETLETNKKLYEDKERAFREEIYDGKNQLKCANSELARQTARAKCYKRLIRHLNRRFVAITKEVRRGKPPASTPTKSLCDGATCAILGTYHEMMGEPF